MVFVSHTDRQQRDGVSTACVCLGGSSMAQVPDSTPPQPPWRPEKLIGSIWLSEKRECPPPLPAPHPTLALLSSLWPSPPPVVAATLGTHMAKTSLAVSFVCVCVCEIYRGVWRQTGQPAPPFSRPPSCHHRAKGNVGRQAGIFSQSQQGPQGGWRRRGGTWREGKEKRRWKKQCW